MLGRERERRRETYRKRSSETTQKILLSEKRHIRCGSIREDKEEFNKR